MTYIDHTKAANATAKLKLAQQSARSRYSVSVEHIVNDLLFVCYYCIKFPMNPLRSLVNVLLLPAGVIRDYMLNAGRIGMTDGTYVYFGIDVQLES